MIFNDSTKYQALTYPLNWCADYKSGEHYAEFDLENGKSNDFYKIRVEDVLRFGLFGQNGKFYFDLDGSFMFNDRRIEVEYHLSNGEIINLTTNFNDKDLITYKQAYSEFRKVGSKQPSRIESFNFGYKTQLFKDNLQIFFQAIVTIPIKYEDSDKNESYRPYMEVKLTSNKELNGDLVFKFRGNEVDRYEAPLEINHSGIMKWTIK